MKTKIVLGVFVVSLLLLVGIGIFVVAYVLSNFPGDAYKVTNESMMPNFEENQQIMIQKITADQIQRGDVVLCELRGVQYIKRVVGLPGEEIKIERDGTIFINREKLTEPYAVIPGSYLYSATTLQNDEYFVLGDNRPASADSHVFGPIKADAILGKVIE